MFYCVSSGKLKQLLIPVKKLTQPTADLYFIYCLVESVKPPGSQHDVICQGHRGKIQQVFFTLPKLLK